MRAAGPGLRPAAGAGSRSTARAPPQLRKQPAGRHCRPLCRAGSFPASEPRKGWLQGSRHCLRPAFKLHSSRPNRRSGARPARKTRQQLPAQLQRAPAPTTKSFTPRRAHVAAKPRHRNAPNVALFGWLPAPCCFAASCTALQLRRPKRGRKLVYRWSTGWRPSSAPRGEALSARRTPSQQTRLRKLNPAYRARTDRRLVAAAHEQAGSPAAFLPPSPGAALSSQITTPAIG